MYILKLVFLSFFLINTGGVGSRIIWWFYFQFCFFFLKKLHTVLQVSTPISIPTNSASGFLSHLSQHFLLNALVLSSIANPHVFCQLLLRGICQIHALLRQLCALEHAPVCARSRAALSALLTYFASCVTCSTTLHAPAPARNLFLNRSPSFQGKARFWLNNSGRKARRLPLVRSDPALRLRVKGSPLSRALHAFAPSARVCLAFSTCAHPSLEAERHFQKHTSDKINSPPQFTAWPKLSFLAAWTAAAVHLFVIT